MPKNSLPPQVVDVFVFHNIPMPDLCFCPDVLDHTREEYSSGLEDEHWDFINSRMKETRANGQMLKGNYLFIDEGMLDGSPVYLYAGKSVRLRNRIRQHWHDYTWLAVYWKNITDTMCGVPIVYVWFNDGDRPGFEKKLADVLLPVYNRRKE